jgi:hypothetical protein
MQRKLIKKANKWLLLIFSRNRKKQHDQQSRRRDLKDGKEPAIGRVKGNEYITESFQGICQGARLA